MQYVHQYLVRKGKMPASPDQFLQRLNDLWFTLYRREAMGDSSGNHLPCLESILLHLSTVTNYRRVGMRRI